MSTTYTGHGENTGGLQQHSIGDIYPLAIAYAPYTSEYTVWDTTTGGEFENRFVTAGEAYRWALNTIKARKVLS